MKPMNSSQIRTLKRMIERQWGCTPRLDYLFFINSEGRVFIVNRLLEQLDMTGLNINSVGLYFGRLVHGELKLSIEGTMMIGPLARANVIELNATDFRHWVQGLDLDLAGSSETFVIIKSGEDYFGCARHTRGKLLNLTPKERRLRVLT